MKPVYLIFIAVLLGIQCDKNQQLNNRKYLSLNGQWEIEESYDGGAIPSAFSRVVPVPGLADMVEPAFDSIGYNQSGNRYIWYKRNFILEKQFPVVRLKINKAKFGTKVFVNGNAVGSRHFSFTPTFFEVQDYLNDPGEGNELVIRIGAAPKNLPDTIPYGHDFEKLKYIPGIYDDVQLICSSKPYISNVQIAPDIEDGQIEVQVSLEGGEVMDDLKIAFMVTEDSSGNMVARGEHVPDTKKDTSNGVLLTFQIAIPGARLWSPEHPFLYKLQLSAGSDAVSERFGMRTFRMDPETGRAYLNGKPYFMRGTNVNIFRFFEDPQRGGLPWDEDWAREVHQKFKSVHWNSIRYCIGYPPEKWYDIADEEGFLIQNEYPLWGNKKVSADALEQAYTAAMKAYWNHPCVVIWDAQNETFTEASGVAIQQVRQLDLSNRPWDNGWAPPQALTDAIETHPYLFSRYRKEGPPKEYLEALLSEPQIPGNGPSERSPKASGRYENAIIINEYAWLWLNRDGTPTTLTDEIYEQLLGKKVTLEQRLDFYAHHLGMLTEYWRCHRTSAAVLHFCGLGYSRPESPRGQTSDNFTDIQNLTYEPHFLKYVKPAFSPVGVMMDYWKIYHKPETTVTIPVFIINDTYEDYAGNLQLLIKHDGDETKMVEERIEVKGLDRFIGDFTANMPKQSGKYQLIAEIKYNGRSIRSIRNIEIEK